MSYFYGELVNYTNKNKTLRGFKDKGVTSVLSTATSHIETTLTNEEGVNIVRVYHVDMPSGRRMLLCTTNVI